MELRRFSYTIFLVFGAIKLINATCNSANSGILESAFGPVIKTKLEDQSEEIKVSIKSGLDEQNEILEGSFKEMIDQNNEELQQVINGTLQNIREDLFHKIGQERQVMQAKFDDQDVKIANKFEHQSDTFEASFESGLDEKMENLRPRENSKWFSLDQVVKSRDMSQSEATWPFLTFFVDNIKIEALVSNQMWNLLARAYRLIFSILLIQCFPSKILSFIVFSISLILTPDPIIIEQLENDAKMAMFGYHAT